MELYERTPPIPPEEYVRIDAEKLKEYVCKVIEAFNVPEHDARIVADVLVTADLFGIESHGVQRLGRYVRGLKSGSIKAKPQIKVVRDSPACALIDGDSGLGQVVCMKAVQIAIEKAEKCGVGVVGVRNSNHFGIAGYYALKISSRKMIGIVLTNSRPLACYTHTIGRNIGTNPIAISIPTKEPPPYLFDAATSVVPIGKIEVLVKEGRKAPLGWGVDEHGELTEDPKIILERGAVLPLGGLGEVLGGHKGSGLSISIDILCGVLTGANWGLNVGLAVEGRRANVGHFIVAINIESFMEFDQFTDRMEEFRSYIKSLPKHPKAERIWIPGEKAWLTMQTRLKIGIPIHKAIIEELKAIGSEVGLEFELEKMKK